MRRLATPALAGALLVGTQLLSLAPTLGAQSARSTPAAAAASRAHRDDVPRSRRVPRKWLFLGIGAAVGFAASSAYTLNSTENTSAGTCSSSSCVGTVSIIGGSLVGFMVGREFDQLYALRYRGGAPLTLQSVSATLDAEANDLVARDTAIAVAVTSGVQLFSGGRGGLHALNKRASGVRGIGALDIVPPAGALAIGSPAGLYVYPPGSGPGLLARDGRVTAVSSSAGRVYFAVGNRVEVAPMGADTLRVWPGVGVGGPVETLYFDESRNVLWAGVDTMLVALRPAGDSVERIASVSVGAPVRRLTSDSAGRLAVALGEQGVRLYEAADPARVRELSRWNTARFVYDVAFAAGRIFAASGVEGLYVIDASTSQLATLGLDRELGFVVALAAVGPNVYLIDRNTDTIRRISADFSR